MGFNTSSKLYGNLYRLTGAFGLSMSTASLDSTDNTKDEEMRREILIRLNVMIEMSTIFRFSEVAFKS